jgi:hypothetical protein
MIKFITVFETQYGLDKKLLYDMLANVKATDYVFIPKAYGNANYKKIASMINSLLEKKPTAKVWIGTPGINSTNFTSLPSVNTIINFITDIQKSIYGSQGVISGVYYNQEAMYGTPDQINKQIHLMQEVKKKIYRLLGTDRMLWIPYYGVGRNAASIIKNIALVADGYDIFNYVILQPHYLFEPKESKGNFKGITYSIKKNRICYRNGIPAYFGKVRGSRKIGFEMEYSPNPTYYCNYKDYCNTFCSMTDIPYGYYWQTYQGSTKEYATIKAELNMFYRLCN